MTLTSTTRSFASRAPAGTFQHRAIWWRPRVEFARGELAAQWSLGLRRRPALPQAAGSPAVRRPSLQYARARFFSNGIELPRIVPFSSGFFSSGLGSSFANWRGGSGFSLGLGTSSFSTGFASGLGSGGLGGGGGGLFPAALAHRPAVKRPEAGRVPVLAARVWAAASARAPPPPAPLVWHPAAAGSDWGGWLGSPALSSRAERLSASLPAAAGRTASAR